MCRKHLEMQLIGVASSVCDTHGPYRTIRSIKKFFKDFNGFVVLTSCSDA